MSARWPGDDLAWATIAFSAASPPLVSLPGFRIAGVGVLIREHGEIKMEQLTSDARGLRRRSLRERLGLPSEGGPGGVGSTRYLARWVVFGIIVGIAAGLGAIVFFWLLDHGTALFLGNLAGYRPPTPVGEGGRGITPILHRWAFPLVVALGGLLSGLLVFLLAPEAEGHGTDSAIEAFHHKGGRVRARIIPIKTIASAITIGAGGSGGREGPTAQISAGVGSLIGQLLHLEPNETRMLVATGIGAGIGAIFRAPLGGAVLSAEILYTHDLEVEVLFPGLIASIIGYSIFGAWAGWQPIFGAQPELGFTNPLQLFYYALLGILCGLLGIAYAKLFYGTVDLTKRIGLPNWLKPAIGGLLVGAIGLAIPETLGTGYGWLQFGMSDRIATLPLWIILALPLVKIVATSLSIGTGGSGGIFGPGMVIGGMLGAAFWQVGHHVLPGMPGTPAAFTIVAMMALFGGVAHAPIAVMLMVAEMTGNLSLLAPAMIAVGLATLVTGSTTIYRGQLRTRADSPAHRYQFSFPLLSSLSVRDAMARAPNFLTFRPDMSVAEAEAGLADETLSGAPVVVDHRRLIGVATLADIERVAPAQRPEVALATIMTRNPATIDPDAGLDVALEALSTRRVSWMPVVQPRDQQVIGLISAAGVISAYRGALRRTVRKMRGLTDDTVLLESQVEAGSPLAGKCLREMRLPAETLVVSIQREGITIMPRGDTQIHPGDLLMVLTGADHEQQVREFLEPSLGEQQAAAEQGSLTNGAS